MTKRKVLKVAAGIVIVAGVAALASQWLRNNKRRWVQRDYTQAARRKNTASSYRLELHCHSDASSDGVMNPEQLVMYYSANGYNALALTDHNTVDNIEAVQKAAASIAPHMLIIPGVEWTTMRCHINIYGFSPENWKNAPNCLKKASTSLICTIANPVVYPV